MTKHYNNDNLIFHLDIPKINAGQFPKIETGQANLKNTAGQMY
jgi:hypothetical protein